jgi:hypothetical protein
LRAEPSKRTQFDVENDHMAWPAIKRGPTRCAERLSQALAGKPISD